MKYSMFILFLFIIGCTLFEKEERLLSEHIKSNGEKILISYIGLGATTNDVIQIRKSNQQTPIHVFDKYNYLKTSHLLNDSILELVFSDTGYHNYNNKLDTILVNVK